MEKYTKALLFGASRSHCRVWILFKETTRLLKSFDNLLDF